MTLGSTQPLTGMSTRSISWGKGGQCVRMITLPPSCAVVMKSGNLNDLNAELNPICHLLALLGAHHILHVSRIMVNFLETSGPVQACNGTDLPFTLSHNKLLSPPPGSCEDT